jgi:hypothetical protein
VNYYKNFKKQNIMKELRKKDIEALRKVMPVLKDMEQISVVGGSGDRDCILTYTTDEYYTLEANGKWTAGYVEGAGWIGGDSGSSNYGSGSSISDPWTANISNYSDDIKRAMIQAAVCKAGINCNVQTAHLQDLPTRNTYAQTKPDRYAPPKWYNYCKSELKHMERRKYV